MDTAQKLKFCMKDFFSNLLKKSFMENFIFCAVGGPYHLEKAGSEFP